MRGVKAALGGIGLAVLAMGALHGIQPGFNPIQVPISFYVHGRHGWLLSVALGAFGGSAVLLSRDLKPGPDRAAAEPYILWFGAGMLLAAAIPSDPWFPWQDAPSFRGAVHALSAVFAPPLLMFPMFRRRWMVCRTRAWSAVRNLLVCAYLAGLAGSGLSLVVGFARDGAPPFIGLAERALAIGAAGWLAMIGCAQLSRTPAAPGSSRGDEAEVR